jgi:hypothetical protein
MIQIQYLRGILDKSLSGQKRKMEKASQVGRGERRGRRDCPMEGMVWRAAIFPRSAGCWVLSYLTASLLCHYRVDIQIFILP